MDKVKGVLSRNQLYELEGIIKILQELLVIAQAAQRCEMNCGDWPSVAATMLRKAQRLLDNFDAD